MATRLEKAIAELQVAAGGRPFILVMKASHDESQNTAYKMMIGGPQPAHALLGWPHLIDRLVREYLDGLDSQLNMRQSQEWHRDDRRTLDLLALVCHNIGSIGITKILQSIRRHWTDGMVRAAEEWAAREHHGASDNPDVERVPRPDFIPEEWL